MKKLLALVLALVMTLGLATVGANAAATKYTDADKINYKEAVDVLSAIGVLGGKDAGNFDPAATLKRSEGAKIVAYFLLGNKSAENLKGTGSKFSDVPANHWAAGYIEYLASEGVLGGVGGGEFDPDGTLTTTQFAKMLLVALGYDAEIENFGGADWAINVQKIANRVDLFKGNEEAGPNDAVKREEAALYAFNALKTPLVEYDNNMRVADANGSTIIVGSSNAKPVVTQATYRNNISRKQASINGNNPQTMVEFGEEYYRDLILVNQGSRPNDLGQPTNKWTYKNLEIGTYVDTGSLVKTYTKKVTAKGIYDDIGKSAYDSIIDDLTWLEVYEDGVLKGQWGLGYIDATSANIDAYMSRTNSNKVNNSGNGTVTEVYQDKDNNITIVTYHTYVYKVSGDYNKNTETIYVEAVGDTVDLVPTLANSETNLKAKDFAIVPDLKDGDYVLVTVADADHDGAGTRVIKSVDKAQLLTGTVNSLKKEDSVTIDGTSYSYSTKTLKTADGEHATGDAVKSSEYVVGQKTTVVLDKYGYVVAVDEAVTNPNYVFINKFAFSSGVGNNLVGSAFFSDGSKGEITIDTIYDNNNTKITGAVEAAVSNATASGASGATLKMTDGADKDITYAGWYTYSKDDNNKYYLYAPTGTTRQAAFTNAIGGATVLYDNKVIAIDTSANTTAEPAANFVFSSGATANTIRTNSKTVFIVYDETNSELYTYTGTANAPKVVNGAAGQAFIMAVYDNNNYAKCVFVTADGTPDVQDGSNEALLYVFGNEGEYRDNNNKAYWKWRIIDDKGAITTADAKISGAPFAAEAIYRIGKDSDGKISRGSAIVGVPANSLAGVPAPGIATANGKYFSIVGATAPVSYKSDTLTIGGMSFTLAKDAKITLVVIKNNTPFLLDDRGNDREATYVSASTLVAKFKDYPALTYDVQGRLKDTEASGSTEIMELYVTPTGITTMNVTGGGDVTDAVKAALATAGCTTVNVSGNATISSAVTVGATQTLAITGNLTNSSTITINGTVSVGGNLIDNGHIDVNSGATLNVAGTTTIGGNSITVKNGGNASFTNVTVTTGILTVETGATASATTIVVNNTGTVKAEKKTLSVTGTFTNNGTATDAAGNNLDLATKPAKIDGTNASSVVYTVAKDVKTIALKIVL